MTNDVYLSKLADYIAAIELCIEETKRMAVDVIGKNLLSFDFCFCALMDRNIRLSQGFILMIKDRNLTCAGALLRLQLDNCLRLYAIYISENDEDIVTCLLNGGKMSSCKDKNGRKMTDAYLQEQFEKYDSRIKTVYNNASGFIHFSSKAIFQSIYECKDNAVCFQVGDELHEKRNGVLLECAEAYVHYYNLFLKFMRAEAEWKKRFDQSIE